MGMYVRVDANINYRLNLMKAIKNILLYCIAELLQLNVKAADKMLDHGKGGS